MNPNHRVTWLRTRPELTITYLRGTSTNRGYHESFYEVISERELNADAWKHLDAAGLTGMGQSYHVQKHETFEDVVPPVVVDERTGKVVDGETPRNHRGEPFTKTNAYEYHRYELLRICDSGD